ncbi:hypothetical protein SAMN02745146_1845 [Hymenobacter daecheongensis DSM 21074]|uniref:Uncharacterized protein n=1 Tax=Hymenobacter daecheongensis DSM 21074 TaxID=1121955 RepID=A0A1M6EWP5_9BACT|nr:hypothetical protein [Hymenobacter daecheongensis]SHI89852.1 hypothetical protein SAMN02745146_1845 [Hymenobacter daecheongensis DSM 21074]
MSPTPTQPEAGRLNLQRAISQLPAHQPAAGLWPRIADELSAAEAIDRALPALPTHEPPAALWAAISAGLDQPEASPLTIATEPAQPTQPAPPVRPLWPAFRLVAGVAAAVLVALLGWWQRPAARPHETITYSEEVVAEPAARPALAAFDPLDEQGLSFINDHCTSLPTVCQSAEFRELRGQLTELQAEEQRLRQDARRFGPTPELVRHQVRITTLKATVTRELIQLLIS